MGWAYDFSKKEERFGDERKDQEVKFQFSFQKPLFDDLLGLDETWSFGYTQTSFWQIQVDSLPFRTTDYQPEFFVTIPTNDIWKLDYIRVGLNHQSNGEGGLKSRSWNRAYLETTFSLGNLRITPTVWHSFIFDDENKDIRQYMGYGDLKFSYDIADHHLVALWRNNLRFDNQNRGAIELNYYFPLPFGDGIYGYLQYFNGYGESLYDYNKQVNKVMLGISFYEY
ncbi:MAG: phospholipase A [Campylobacter sp.]|nr:phospholipase A [Campylobacter sp.]